MSDDIMSLDELQIHLRMGRSMKGSSNPYIVSYDLYKRIGEAVEHYTKTGELPFKEELEE